MHQRSGELLPGPVIKLLRDPPGDEFHQQVPSLFGLLPLQEVEVRLRLRFRSRFLWHEAVPDAVRGGDDLAVDGLAEDLGEADHGRDSAVDDVAQHSSGSDRGQLVHVAHQNQTGACGKRPQQIAHERDIHHRGLVHDQQIAVDRILFIAGETPGTWLGFEQAVNGFRFQAGGLGEPLGRAAGGRAKNASDLFGSKDGEDGMHQGGLPYSGSSGEDGKPAAQHLA